MGFGISARHRRAESYWRPHLALTKAFVNESLDGLPAGSSVAILGAGRLLDLDVARLRGYRGKITLYDADPSVLPAWRRQLRDTGVELVIGDVTAVMDRWSAEIRAVRGSEATLAGIISGLSAACEDSPVKVADHVISLNLLGQLPIYWRDRIATVKARVAPEPEGSVPLEEAIEASCAALQLAHLELLRRRARHSVSLIYDTRYHFYRRDIAPWQTEEALAIPRVEIDGFLRVARDGWLWHVAPQGIEDPDFGVIHAVAAERYSEPKPSTELFERRADTPAWKVARLADQ
jgi:hypothetical protein